MKKAILNTILLFTSWLIGLTYGQVYSDSTFKAGIYKSFEEFKNNNPSIELTYDIVTSTEGYGILRSEGKLVCYSISIDKSIGKSLGNVFGFSNGKEVYVNKDNPVLSPKINFYKIEFLGKYIYFQDIQYYRQQQGGFYALEERIINLDTGELITLNKKTIRNLISNDIILLEAFENEKQKKNMFKAYLIKYLEKHIK